MTSDEAANSNADLTLQLSADELNIAREILRREREATQPLEEATFSHEHLLAVEVFGFPRLVVAVERDLIIGRSDAANHYYPDIDLSPYGGQRMGVSRRHALLRRINAELYLADYNSRNGTMINEHRLPPQVLHKLRSNDTLAFGTLRLRIRFISASEAE